MPKTSDVGVIVGRFQVHRLHDAHRALIQQVYDTHRQTLIVLGLSPVRVTARNPLDFEARKQLLLDAFPKATVFYLRDERDDAEWSRKLDALVRDYLSPSQTVTFYGGRDSFIEHYTGVFPTDVLEPEVYASGTELRKGISKAVKGSEDFRAGVIWASSNGWPRVFPTVDVAIYRIVNPGAQRVDDAGGHALSPGEYKEWLLVRKPAETLWRFPGGFVDPTDNGLEAAAKREVYEETGLEVGPLQYVASLRVDDWRYRDEADKIITTLFAAPYVFGAVRPADDVAEAKWFEFRPAPGKALAVPIVPEHAPLLEALVTKGRLV